MATFTVKWTNFTVLKKHDVDRDKPYLWVFGIVIDAKSFVSGDYVIRKPSTSENLGGRKFKKGDSVTVPSSLDISREVSPLFGLASAGVVVVAWENALTKDRVIANAYTAAANTIDEFVAALVVNRFEELAAGTPLEEIEFNPTDAEMNALRADLEREIRDTIREGSHLIIAIHDHFIDTVHTIVVLEEPFERCLDYRFVNGSTDYNLEGDMTYGEPATRTGRPPGRGDIPVKYQEPKPQATHRS